MNNRHKASSDDPLLANPRRRHRDPIVYVRPHAVSLEGYISDVTGNKAGSAHSSKIASRPLSSPALPKAEALSIDLVKPTPTSSRKRPDLPKQTRSNVLKRQISKPSFNNYHPKHRRAVMPAAIMAFAILIFITGGIITANVLLKNNTAKTEIAELARESEKSTVLGITDELPSETPPPTNLSSYEALENSPRTLTIKKINVLARVQRVGVTTENILKFPVNIFDAGWYQSSSKPGEPGAVLIGGHVSGPTKSGIFYSIGSLKAGDKINLERGDGKVFNYTVIDTQLYDSGEVDMRKLLAAINPDKPGLNLLTSSGRFNIATDRFEKRVAVFATQD